MIRQRLHTGALGLVASDGLVDITASIDHLDP